MNILVLTSTFPTFLPQDATPPFVYGLSRGMSHAGKFNVIVLTPYRKNARLRETREGVKIYRFRYGFSKLCEGAILPSLKKNILLWFQVPFFFFFYFISIISIVRKENIGIIHAHWLIPQGVLATLYKKFIHRRMKIVCTIHGADIFALRGRLSGFLKRFVIKNVDGLTVVSKKLAHEVNNVYDRKGLHTHVLPMGVDKDVFHSRMYDTRIKERYNITGHFLLFVGRLEEKKGVQYLIDAMPRIIKKFNNVQLIIIGGGTLQEQLQKLVLRLKLEKNVLFLGPVKHNDLPAFFATADIFIGPSVQARDGDQEGFGLVFVEALMSDTCVVASNLPAISDIIIHGKTGIRVDVKQKDVFSDAIIQLLSNSQKRQYLSKNGQSFVREKFSLHAIAYRYSSFIEKCY